MAKRKEEHLWDHVFGRVRCLWYSEKVYPPKTTAGELDGIEEQLRFQFPSSYRAFVEQFGLGGSLEVAHFNGIRITLLPLSRGTSRERNHWATVVDRTLGVRTQHSAPGELPLLYRHSGPRPSSTTSGRSELPIDSRETTEFGNLVVFAGDDDEGLGHFLFQPLEITDTEHRECRIFAMNGVRSLRPIADSFWEWLEWVERMYNFPPPEEENERPARPAPVIKPDPAGASMQYERAWLRDKKSPTQRNVKLWLASNNHTARDLALSIRDHGLTDAFPILADALLDAGCTSDDLLEACRTGEPDIDGGWVLQTLLGKS